MNKYTNVVNHAVLDTENEKSKLVVQSLSHDGGKPDFVDIRKFRTYGENGELKFTNKGVHFHNDQLLDVIVGLIDAYERINEHSLFDMLTKKAIKDDDFVDTLPDGLAGIINMNVVNRSLMNRCFSDAHAKAYGELVRGEIE